MTIDRIERNNTLCAVIDNEEEVITDVQSALDLLMSTQYTAGTKNIIIHKQLIVDEFFILSMGLAGEIL